MAKACWKVVEDKDGFASWIFYRFGEFSTPLLILDELDMMALAKMYHSCSTARKREDNVKKT